MVATNIPKTGTIEIAYFHKYFNRNILNESTLRKNYLSSYYLKDRCLKKAMKYIRR